jgi:hypothetical protein
MLQQSHPFLDARAPSTSDNVANWGKTKKLVQGAKGAYGARDREEREEAGGVATKSVV